MKIDVKGNSPKPKNLRFPRHGQQDAQAIANKPIKGMYADKPAVPTGKIAGESLQGSLGIGDGVPKMVPHQFGAFQGPAENFPKRQIQGADLKAGRAAPVRTPHGFGHSAIQSPGKLRVSGHSGAHRIGKK